MFSKIEQFTIKGLHGYKTFDLHFKDNTIILVGENGSGKTTVLRLLFYLLSGQWAYMAQYHFQELSVVINGKTYRLPYDLVAKRLAKLDERVLSRIPPLIRGKLIQLFQEGGGSNFILAELEELAHRAEIPLGWILDLMEPPKEQSKELMEIYAGISKSLDCQVLYLPTYRRIEQELSSIFKGIDEDEWRHTRQPSMLPSRIRHRPVADTYVELIEFGMRDVDLAITNGLQRLKDFHRESLNTMTLGYLGDIVDQMYLQVQVQEIRGLSRETISSVLDSIPESILSRSRKEHVFKTIDAVRKGGAFDDHPRVICHYFLKLLRIQEDLREKESQMTNFSMVCNEYLRGDKKFVYDSANFTLLVKASFGKGNERTIALRQLSSGEKQIVSLFSHLYLSGKDRYFLLIDEPELSLSVPWQRRFLMDIKKGKFCWGIVAATHSPFIYDNELKRYAKGLGEVALQGEPT